jgi:hypothetical protein
MTTTNRLNLLLSDILQTEPSSTNKIYHGSLNPTSSLLTFAGEDYRPSVTAIASLSPRHNTSSLKHHRQRPYIHQSDNLNEQQTQPLLNSSTLDDLFRALTLECEQYLSASSTSTYQNKTYGQLIVQPSTPIQTTNIDSNDDDYENLHGKNFPLSNGLSSLKTSIEVMRPEKRQIVAINVSSKNSPSPIVSSSRTYPLLSASYTTPSMVSSNICHSSEEDSIDVSSSNTNRKRRRRTRKQQILPSIIRSSSSDDERSETINEKKSTISKRSCSTDHRQQRIRSIYDNHPISVLSQKNPPSRRTRRRDVSLQQHVPSSTKYYGDTPLRWQKNLYSPLSVLLTSKRSTSDFVDPSQQRRSRLELVNHQPISLLDRMHQQFYRTSPTNHHNNNIPTQRIPSYPVY